jgi:hypothetical protein
MVGVDGARDLQRMFFLDGAAEGGACGADGHGVLSWNAVDAW